MGKIMDLSDPVGHIGRSGYTDLGNSGPTCSTSTAEWMEGIMALSEPVGYVGRSGATGLGNSGPTCSTSTAEWMEEKKQKQGMMVE
jgi:hypothetical protein